MLGHSRTRRAAYRMLYIKYEASLCFKKIRESQRLVQILLTLLGDIVALLSFCILGPDAIPIPFQVFPVFCIQRVRNSQPEWLLILLCGTLRQTCPLKSKPHGKYGERRRREWVARSHLLFFFFFKLGTALQKQFIVMTPSIYSGEKTGTRWGDKWRHRQVVWKTH